MAHSVPLPLTFLLVIIQGHRVLFGAVLGTLTSIRCNTMTFAPDCGLPTSPRGRTQTTVQLRFLDLNVMICAPLVVGAGHRPVQEQHFNDPV